MKARVVPRRGLCGRLVWLCFTVVDMGHWTVVRRGYGYTVEAAFRDWEEQA